MFVFYLCKLSLNVFIFLLFIFLLNWKKLRVCFSFMFFLDNGVVIVLILKKGNKC